MVDLTVPTGDWIYPSRDSTSRARYPIDYPLVAEIFLPPSRVGKNISRSLGISAHLNGRCFLELQVEDKPNVLRILTIRGHDGEFLPIGHEIKFSPDDLFRAKPVVKAESTDNNALFFADVLLIAYLRGDALPSGISFRRARIPEIEHLGR